MVRRGRCAPPRRAALLGGLLPLLALGDERRGSPPLKGHSAVWRERLDETAWMAVLDTALCADAGGERAPLVGVEFWASRSTRFRLLVVGPRGDGKLQLRAYTRSALVRGGARFRVELARPTVLGAGECVGWWSAKPVVPYSTLPQHGEVPSQIRRSGGFHLAALGAEFVFGPASRPRAYSIRVLDESEVRPLSTSLGRRGVGGPAGVASARVALATLPVPPPQRQPRPSGVAVCIAGDLRMLHLTAAGIVERLAAPLGADLFLYGPKPREDLAALGWLTMQPCTKSVKLFAENVTQAMRTLPREEKAALASAMCNVPGNWLGGAPWLPRCAAASIPETSGWAAPVGRVEGSNVFQMFARKQCLGMVAEHEQHARGGRQYETLVYSRSDLLWLLPHPTQRQLLAYVGDRFGEGAKGRSEDEVAWIPDTLGDDWGGYYDRHLVLNRWQAETTGIMDDWDAVLTGMAEDWFGEVVDQNGPVEAGTPKFEHGVNSEMWLALRMQLGGLPVLRFPALAYVTCDLHAWEQHLAAKPTAVQHRYSKSFPCQSGDSPGAGWRFPQEYLAARVFAECAGRVAAAAGASSAEAAASWPKNWSLWDDVSAQYHCEQQVVAAYAR